MNISLVISPKGAGSAIFTTAVGIGASTPPNDLLSFFIHPPALGTHALVNLTNSALSNDSASGTFIGANPLFASADFINYQVGGITQFKVDKQGYIAIGSTSPATALDIRAGSPPGGVVSRLLNTTVNGLSEMSFYDNSGIVIGGVGGGLLRAVSCT